MGIHQRPVRYVILIGCLLHASLLSFAQVEKMKQPTINKPGNLHSGFYLAMGLGMAGGSVSDEITPATVVPPNTSHLILSGLGFDFSLRIGGTITNTLILHATINTKSVSAPQVKASGQTVTAPSSVALGENMIGAGVTRYFPSNFFFSGSAGLGNFSILDNTTPNGSNVATRRGPSILIMAGKDWWISSRWALGISASYGHTRVTQNLGTYNLSTGSGTVKEFLISNRFGITFNATFD